MDSDKPKIIEQLLKQHFHNKKFKEKYQEEKAEFIKGLEAEIGDELRTRINKIKGRFILLVGKSVKASEAAGRYAYCIKGHTILNFYSFSGKTDERIENILNDSAYDDGKDAPKYGKIVDCLSSGSAVFLGDLECHDRPLLKRLADGIRNVKYENYDKGMLLVSTTTDRDSVPEYFKELFEVEVIELEPEKQDTPVSTPQDTASTPQKGKTKDVIPFPTPPGTQWHEVTISFIDTENVEISARGKTATKHFFDMGFRKGKTCKPVKSWHTLFAFSEKRCLAYSQSIKSKTEKDIQDLRKRLRAYFGIQDDPIILEHGYKPVFKVCRSESEGRSVRAFSNSDIFHEKEDD